MDILTEDRTDGALAAQEIRLKKRDWLVAARKLLLEGGHSSLSLRRLAVSLGVTTGAFYARFRGIGELHDALRDNWRECNVLPFDRAVAAAGDDGVRQYLAYVRVLLLEDEVLPAFENAIREWAASCPTTAALLATTEMHRLHQLRGIFEAMGFSSHEAEIRARVVYFHQVGYTAMCIVETREQRMLNFRYYAHVLAGLSQFMALDSAEAVRDAIVTGSQPAGQTDGGAA